MNGQRRSSRRLRNGRENLNPRIHPNHLINPEKAWVDQIRKEELMKRPLSLAHRILKGLHSQEEATLMKTTMFTQRA